MNFNCQQSAFAQLHSLADAHRHSILIDGVPGCGKSYLAKIYAQLLNVPDIISVQPTVQTIKDTITSCLQTGNDIVLCIENLDCGVVAAAYALLKFLEEPADNIYIVVTCQNIHKVPDTIISRAACVSISPPMSADLGTYATTKYPDKYSSIKDTLFWRCIHSFHDVDITCNLKPDYIQYYNELSTLLGFTQCVSDIVWKLGHYPDNTETPIQLVINYILLLSRSAHIQRCGIECMNDIAANRIASHACLTKFVFECKYCE